MIIIEEYEKYDRNDIVIIEVLTYYKLEFLTNDWILRRSLTICERIGTSSGFSHSQTVQGPRTY